jgi:hypothetical protein
MDTPTLGFSLKIVIIFKMYYKLHDTNSVIIIIEIFIFNLHIFVLISLIIYYVLTQFNHKSLTNVGYLCFVI